MEEDNNILEQTQKKKNKKIWGIIAIIAAIAVIVCISQASVLANTVAKLFMSPQKYYQHIGKKASSHMVDWMATWYSDIVKENINVADRGAELDVAVTVDEDVLDLLGEMLDNDLDFLKNFKYNVAINRKDAQIQFNTGISTEKTVLADATLLLNQQQEKVYFQIPQLMQTHLLTDVDTVIAFLYGEESVPYVQRDFEELETYIEYLEKLYKKLPSNKELQTIFNKYIVLALSCMEDVKEEKAVLTAETFSVNCTKLKVTLDEDCLQNIAEVVLENLETDEELKHIVLDVLSVQDEMDAEELYDRLLELAVELLEEVERIRMRNEIELCVWVDKTGAVCGGSIAFTNAYDETMEASYAIVKAGKNFGIELEAEIDNTKFRMNGTATRKGKKLSGELEVKVAGMKIANIQFSDVEIQKDSLDGTFVFTPKKYIVELLEEEMGEYAPIVFADAAMKIEVHNQTNESVVIVSLLEEETVLASANIELGFDKGVVSALPAEDTCVYTEDREEVFEYFGALEEEELVEALEDANFPENIVRMLEKLFFEIRYERADILYEKGDYKNALVQFEALMKSDVYSYYNDYYYYDCYSFDRELQMCRYELGMECMQQKNYADAKKYFELTDGYKDTDLQLKYIEADEAFQKQAYDTAMRAYEQTMDLYDSKEKYKKCAYQVALDYQEKKQYDQAIDLFEILGEYEESKIKLAECEAAYAMVLYDKFLNNKIKVQYKESYSGTVHAYTMQELINRLVIEYDDYNCDVYYGYCDIGSNSCKELFVKINYYVPIVDDIAEYFVKYKDKKLEVFYEPFDRSGWSSSEYYKNGIDYFEYAGHQYWAWGVAILDSDGNYETIYTVTEDGHTEEIEVSCVYKDKIYYDYTKEQLENWVEQAIKDKGIDPNAKEIELIAWQ